MKQSRRVVALAAAISTVLMVPACISVRGHRLEEVSAWPPAARASKPSVSVMINAGAVRSGPQTSLVPGQFGDLLQSATNAAYRDSGLFSEVRPGLGDTDLRVEVRIANTPDPNLGLAVLSGLSLLVIPAYARDHYAVRTVVRDREGKVLGHTEKSEIVYSWFHIVLMFVMPWTFPDTLAVAREVLYDLSRASILDLRTQKAW